jgi:hypothetical protein
VFLAAISHFAPTELGIYLAVSISINISPLTGLESLKLRREGVSLEFPLKKGGQRGLFLVLLESSNYELPPDIERKLETWQSTRET